MAHFMLLPSPMILGNDSDLTVTALTHTAGWVCYPSSTFSELFVNLFMEIEHLGRR